MALSPLSAAAWGLLPLVLLAGCRGDGGEPDGVATPTSFGQCNHGPRPGGDGAMYSLAAHWKDSAHAYGGAADLFVCVNPAHGGQVSVTAPEGVHVRPSRQPVDTRGDGILRFTVRVQRGASGALEITTHSRDGGGSMAGPEVDTGDNRWSFTEPG